MSDTPREAIHHIDGDPTNNDISNLEVVDVNSHELVTKWRDISRQDDCFNHMVPSDVRVMLGVIEGLSSINADLLEALKAIKAIKPHVIGGSGFQTGPQAHFDQAQRIADAAIAKAES